MADDAVGTASVSPGIFPVFWYSRCSSSERISGAPTLTFIIFPGAGAVVIVKRKMVEVDIEGPPRAADEFPFVEKKQKEPSPPPCQAPAPAQEEVATIHNFTFWRSA
eukprot:jgi/Mesvir1/15873/Mv22368-RA.1